MRVPYFFSGKLAGDSVLKRVQLPDGEFGEQRGAVRQHTVVEGRAR
jgi:hypothetical protein